MKAMREVGYLGTPWSGQDVKWYWVTLRGSASGFSTYRCNKKKDMVWLRPKCCIWNEISGTLSCSLKGTHHVFTQRMESFTHTLDSEHANFILSKWHHSCSGDGQPVVGGLKIASNVVSPVFFTLNLQLKVTVLLVAYHSSRFQQWKYWQLGATW